MEKFLINGGKKLFGSIPLHAGKNAILPILAGCILCDGPIILKNCPEYEDVKNMCNILKYLGANVERDGYDLYINAKTINKNELPHSLTSCLRSSFFSLGPMLAKLKKAKIAYPGGCEIGARPIDLHIKGLQCLNIKIVDKHGFLTCNAQNALGGVVHLDFPSVGATENIMMCACMIKGKTKIYNSAKEPEIVDLQNFLNKMGAKVRGAGTSEIVIEGVEKLHGCEYEPIPDRIITGTYLLAGAMCGGKITLENTNHKHIHSLLSKIKNNGCIMDIKGDRITIEASGRQKAISKVETMPYPGFPTDLQPQLMSYLAICDGTSVIVENLFETRYKHVPELAKMGAEIVQKDRTCVIKGVNSLYGAEVYGTDLRGGASLVLAGLVAKGYTKVGNIHHIDRGYYHMEEDMQKIGADIKRINEET